MDDWLLVEKVLKMKLLEAIHNLNCFPSQIPTDACARILPLIASG